MKFNGDYLPAEAHKEALTRAMDEDRNNERHPQ